MKVSTKPVLISGRKEHIEKENYVPKVFFKKHIFNKVSSTKENTLIICSFSEFGCETITSLYCVDYLKRKNNCNKVIVIGWLGRDYLYKHQVDEFWEINEDFQFLRSYAGAFHHKSKTLDSIEEQCSEFGTVIKSKELSNIALTAQCRNCRNIWGSTKFENFCPKCYQSDISQSIFGNIPSWKRQAVKLPEPSESSYNRVKEYLEPNMVAIFARGRKTYGRNLTATFYVDLIDLIKSHGYNPVWLGEKESTLPCPVKSIKDFSRTKLSKDLENTLAIINKCEFTIQFWTASTRLAGLMGIPYILVESPSQIWKAHEGFRRNLCDFGPSKLICSNYMDFKENWEVGLEVVNDAINDVKNKDFKILADSRISDIPTARHLYMENVFRIGDDVNFKGVENG